MPKLKGKILKRHKKRVKKINKIVRAGEKDLTRFKKKRKKK